MILQKDLAKSKSSKNVDELKSYLIKAKNLANKNYKKELQSTNKASEYDTAREYNTDMPFLETAKT